MYSVLTGFHVLMRRLRSPCLPRSMVCVDTYVYEWQCAYAVGSGNHEQPRRIWPMWTCRHALRTWTEMSRLLGLMPYFSSVQVWGVAALYLAMDGRVSRRTTELPDHLTMICHDSPVSLISSSWLTRSIHSDLTLISPPKRWCLEYGCSPPKRLSLRVAFSSSSSSIEYKI